MEWFFVVYALIGAAVLVDSIVHRERWHGTDAGED